MFGFGDGKSKDDELDEFLGEADQGETRQAEIMASQGIRARVY